MSSREDLEAKNTPEDHYLPPKKRRIFQEPKRKPRLEEEETSKMTTTPMEDLETKNGPQDPDLATQKRKIFQEPRSKANQVEEETGKTTAATTGGNRSHRNCSIEDLEAKKGRQDPNLTTQKKKIFQEPRSKTNQVDETRRTTAVRIGGNYSRRNCSMEDLEAEKGPQDPDLPSKKRKISQETKEEARKTTISAVSGGDCSHYNRPCKKLCTGVRPCKGLMHTLLRLSPNRPVRVLRKKLYKTDVDPGQNRLQHSEKEVKQVLLGMMTAEEKQLAMQEGVGDGLRVTVLDRLGRVYHMKFKMLHSKKYFRFRGSDYQKFTKNNNLKAGDILDTWASRVQLRGGGRMREEGDGGIVDGELLLVMLNYEVENYRKETDVLTPAEREAIDALLLLQNDQW